MQPVFSWSCVWLILPDFLIMINMATGGLCPTIKPCRYLHRWPKQLGPSYVLLYVLTWGVAYMEMMPPKSRAPFTQLNLTQPVWCAVPTSRRGKVEKNIGDICLCWGTKMTRYASENGWWRKLLSPGWKSCPVSPSTQTPAKHVFKLWRESNIRELLTFHMSDEIIRRVKGTGNKSSHCSSHKRHARI